MCNKMTLYVLLQDEQIYVIDEMTCYGTSDVLQTGMEEIRMYLAETWSTDGLDQVVIFSMAYFIFGACDLNPAPCSFQPQSLTCFLWEEHCRLYCLSFCKLFFFASAEMHSSLMLGLMFTDHLHFMCWWGVCLQSTDSPR